MWEEENGRVLNSLLRLDLITWKILKPYSVPADNIFRWHSGHVLRAQPGRGGGGRPAGRESPRKGRSVGQASTAACAAAGSAAYEMEPKYGLAEDY